MSALNTLVSEAIDIVVYCTRGKRGPRVTEILAVEDLAAGPEATHFTVTDLFSRGGYDHPIEWTGNVPVRANTAFENAEVPLSQILQSAARVERP